MLRIPAYLKIKLKWLKSFPTHLKLHILQILVLMKPVKRSTLFSKQTVYQNMESTLGIDLQANSLMPVPYTSKLLKFGMYITKIG